MKICAELKDGTVVEEKSKIPEVTYEKISQINRIYISPSNVLPAPGVIDAIKDADAIVIGPGSLYTNIIPNLIVKNVAKAIKESKAKKVYISNIMTEPGQTDNYTVGEHINAIIEHAGKGVIEYCICDTGDIIPEFIRRYNAKGSDTVDQSIEKVNDKNIKVIRKDVSCIKNDNIRHDPDSVASVIMELICNDLKFKDEKNNKQYMLLNSKIKEQKKIDNKKIKEKKKARHIEEKKKAKRIKRYSKFAEKYSDRIESIQQSENIRQENLKKQEMENKKQK